MAAYRLARTPQFEKSVSKLSPEIKQLLAKQLYLLECDPRHPSLYTKKNKNATASMKHWFSKVASIPAIDFYGCMMKKNVQSSCYLLPEIIGLLKERSPGNLYRLS